RSPKPVQRVFSKEIGELNTKYRARLASLPRDQLIYWLQMFGWWATGSVLLYLIGWTIGWVARGFRSTSTEAPRAGLALHSAAPTIPARANKQPPIQESELHSKEWVLVNE